MIQSRITFRRQLQPILRSLPVKQANQRFTNSFRHQSTISNRPLKLAIIGAGPSGFYTASRIVSSVPLDSPAGKDVEIHMYERLPTPYGLVRYGVAPDHPEVKNCQHKFDELSLDPRFKFFGNVNISPQSSSTPNTTSTPSPQTSLSPYTYPHALQIPLTSLLPYYSTLLLTYGASLSNPLTSVSGSSSSSNPLNSVFPALAFVSWYNGHPAFSNLQPDLKKIQQVTVIGHGNVALDVSRILLKSMEELESTDIPRTVLDVLGESSVKRVKAVGRRGPGQVAFTTKEFREMLNLPGVEFGGVDKSLLEEGKKVVEGDRMRKRLLGLMETGQKDLMAGNKKFELDFLKSPKAFIPSQNDPSRVGSIEWNINTLLSPTPSTPSPPNSQTSSIPSPSGLVARPTGEVVTEKTDMIIESVGYRSEPLGSGEEGWKLPFDVGRGRVRNNSGRVIDDEGLVIPGIYAAGWAARGPVGVIASTMHDAYALSATILSDHYDFTSSSASSSPLKTLPEQGLPEDILNANTNGKIVVDLEKWGKIDQAERDRVSQDDRARGKEREKFIRVEDMLEVL